MIGLLNRLFGGLEPSPESMEDESDEFAEAAMAVKLKCEIAAMSGRNLGDPKADDFEYEKNRYQKLRDEAISMTLNIHDEFYQGFALHQIARLCQEANDLETVRPLFAAIDDEFLRVQILNDVPELKT